MRRHYGKRTGSILAALMLAMTSLAGASLFASAEEETEAEAMTEVSAAEPTELILDLGDETKTVMNDAGEDLDGAVLVLEEADAAEGAAEGEAQTEDAAEPEASESGRIVLTEADGTEHTFEISDPETLSSLSNMKLTESIGFLFLSGTATNGEEKYYYEDADEVTLDEPVIMYTVGMVNIREDGNGDAELVGTAERGSEVEVLGGTSSWFLISQDDQTGYVAARYLTSDPSEAEAAVEAEESARAAAAAAAEAAASYGVGGGSSAGSTGGSTGESAGQTAAATDDACLTGGVLN